MATQRRVTLSVVSLAAALAASLAAAAPTLSTEYRYAAQLAEYFVRGDAAVSGSPTLKQGLRLAAWDGRNEQEATRVAVATAVYFFEVPAAARSLTIEVGYRAAGQAAQNSDIAGFLFVRSKAIEEQYAELNAEGKRPVEEPGFFGNTYFLPAKETAVTVTLPAGDHVIDGVLEVHLTAGAGQAFDAQYIQVKAFGAEVPVRVEYVPVTRYVLDPYQYTYYYYYAGPCYYPTGTSFACFYPFGSSIDPIYWGGWHARRACYFTYHPWVYRPAYYVHPAPIVIIQRPIYIVKPVIIVYRNQWYRRHFRLDCDRARDHEFDRIVRRRVEVLGPDRIRDFRRNAQVIADNVRDSERDLRTRLGARFPNQLAAWQLEPARASRELQALDRSQTIRRASADWAAIRTQRWQETEQAVRSTQLNAPPSTPATPPHNLRSGLRLPDRLAPAGTQTPPPEPATAVSTPQAQGAQTQDHPRPLWQRLFPSRKSQTTNPPAAAGGEAATLAAPDQAEDPGNARRIERRTLSTPNADSSSKGPFIRLDEAEREQRTAPSLDQAPATVPQQTPRASERSFPRLNSRAFESNNAPRAIELPETPRVIERSQPRIELPETPRVIQRSQPRIELPQPRVLERSQPRIELPETPRVIERPKPEFKPAPRVFEKPSPPSPPTPLRERIDRGGSTSESAPPPSDDQDGGSRGRGRRR